MMYERERVRRNHKQLQLQRLRLVAPRSLSHVMPNWGTSRGKFVHAAPRGASVENLSGWKGYISCLLKV